MCIRDRGFIISQIARPHILQYKEDLLSTGKSSLTVGSYINSVRRFYEWTEANKFYPNVAKGIKTPKRKQQFYKQPLLPDQSKALLNYFENKALRDYSIINLMSRTGIRLIEVIRANIEDITYKGSQRVLMIQGKGRDEKDNFVVLTDKAYNPIKNYLASRSNTEASEPLFISVSNNSKGNRISTRYISQIAKEGLKAIGLDSHFFTAHSLRHSVGCNILRETGDLERTRLALRHSNPATTLIYVATIEEERRLKNSGEALIDSLYLSLIHI